jgi:HEPN domain-containing protein
MRRHFQSSLPRNFVELDIDPSRLAGSGNADYPQLSWQMEMPLDAPKTPQTDYAFRAANAQLYFATGPCLKIADARPLSLDRVIPGHLNHSITEYPNFEFPLDARRIAAIERVRQGGSLQFNLHMQVVVDEIGINPAHEPTKRPAVWGLKAAHQLSMQERFDVPQSHWVERVLPNIGYGQVHLIELPVVPLEQMASLQKSFDALKEAQEHHKQGFYNAAVVNCRQALDSMLTAKMEILDDGGNKRLVPCLDERWKMRLGQSTYDWLNEALASLKTAGNDAAHRNRNNFDQFESQMIQAVTTTLLAYAARAPHREFGDKP